MPAVTADTLTLPRLPSLDESGTRWRPVARVVTAIRTLEGEGFQVRRPFPSAELPLADPFLLLDQMGAVEYAPGEAKGTPWHPHRGFETVTYMMDGAFEHQDTTGGGGLITDGATQWMTAGAGTAAHRTAAGCARRKGRTLPRRAALGKPAGVEEVDAAGIPGHRSTRREARLQRRRFVVGAHHRGRAGGLSWPGLNADADHVPARDDRAGLAPAARLAARLQRARLRARRQRLRRAASGGRSTRGSSPSSARATRSPSARRTSSRLRRRGDGRSLCLAACRFASRWRDTDRSS